MSNSQPEVDKEKLYKEYLARQRWQDKLFRRGCHKALDIPEDEMNFHQQTGINGRHLVWLTAFIVAGLLGWHGIDRLSTDSTEPPSPVSSPAAPPAKAQDFRVQLRGGKIWLEKQPEQTSNPERESNE